MIHSDELHATSLPATTRRWWDDPTPIRWQLGREEYRRDQAWRVALLYQLIVCSDAGCMFCRATLREKGLP